MNFFRKTKQKTVQEVNDFLDEIKTISKSSVSPLDSDILKIMLKKTDSEKKLFIQFSILGATMLESYKCLVLFDKIPKDLFGNVLIEEQIKSMLTTLRAVRGHLY